jgi:hypothetical protein
MIPNELVAGIFLRAFHRYATDELLGSITHLAAYFSHRHDKTQRYEYDWESIGKICRFIKDRNLRVLEQKQERLFMLWTL